MLQVHTLTFNPFEENTYVVFDESREAAIIDPGCSDPDEQEQLARLITHEKLTVKLLLNTHCHIDHVLGNYFVKTRYNVPFWMHAEDLPVLRAVKSYASNYGFPGYQEVLPDRLLGDGEKIKVGKSDLSILFLPGHSPGHIGFYNSSQKILLAGDVLFYRSIGRTDLPGGNLDTLMSSIQQKLFALPDDVVVFPGHGPTTTLGEEKVSNPFCALSV